MNLCLLSQGCCSCSSKFPMRRGASPLLPQPQQPVAEVIPSSWGRAFALPSMENLAAVRKAGERCFFNELMRQQPGISVPRRAHWTDELAPFSPETCRGEPWSPPDLALLPQQGVRDALLHPPGKPPQWLAPAPLPRPRSPPGGPGHAWVPPAVLHGHQAGHTWGCAPALADGETEARRSLTQRSPPGIPALALCCSAMGPKSGAITSGTSSRGPHQLLTAVPHAARHFGASLRSFLQPLSPAQLQAARDST